MIYTLPAVTAKTNTPAKQYAEVDYTKMRPEQWEFMLANILSAISASYANSDERIITVTAPTGTGKTYVMVNFSMVSFLKVFPNVTRAGLVIPDAGCVEKVYADMHEKWHGKILKRSDGSEVEIDVRHNDAMSGHTKTPGKVFITVCTVQWYYRTYDGSTFMKPMELLLVDEIHYGMGTVDSDDMWDNRGTYRNNNFQACWLNLLRSHSLKGSKIVGYSGTLTASQQMQTDAGIEVFHNLKPLEKNDLTSIFPVLRTSKNLILTEAESRAHIESSIKDICELMNKIDTKTWEALAECGVRPYIPGFMFKYGSANTKKGLSVVDHRDSVFDFSKKIGADLLINLSNDKVFVKYANGRHNAVYKPTVVGALTYFNDPVNFNKPYCVMVDKSGNMGWDKHRTSHVVCLAYPSNPNTKVTNQQVQLFSRSNRIAIEGFTDHTALAEKLGKMPVSAAQRDLAIQYVVKQCTSYICIPADSQLLLNAYRDFSLKTMTPEKGLDYYRAVAKDATTSTSINKVKPRFTLGYEDGGLNSLFKKDHCEVCGGECKAHYHNKMGSFMKQAYDVSMTDDEFNKAYRDHLNLHHIDGDRTNYHPENLMTLCATAHGVITMVLQDFLIRYPDKGLPDVPTILANYEKFKLTQI
jgi:hypothetical protein